MMRQYIVNLKGTRSTYNRQRCQHGYQVTRIILNS